MGSYQNIIGVLALEPVLASSAVGGVVGAVRGGLRGKAGGE